MGAVTKQTEMKADEGVLNTEVGKALLRSKRAFIGVGIFSAVINVLMLTGPLYMLQVYDRVLASSSMSTLVAISVLMALMFAFVAVFELLRTRILVRIGDRLDKDLGARTFAIWLKQGLFGRAGQRHRPLRDLATVKQFFSGTSPSTFFDIPWAPIYIGIMFIFHPVLGIAGVLGAVIIFILAYINEKSSRKPMQDANAYRAKGQNFAEITHRNADAITAMGMEGDMQARWAEYTKRAADETLRGSDRNGGITAVSKAFRMFVQSGILGLGAALAVQQIITPGTMIAGSIIMGRALAPIQMVVGQWRGFISARQSFNRLNTFFNIIPEDVERMQLPAPEGHISVKQVIASPPGMKTALLAGLNFTIEPGQGLGVIGPSASGKSTLARLLVGIWLPQKGAVRLDGATFDQWNRSALGPYIGYLPQDVEMFDGSIGDNIARFMPNADPQAVVLAARRAAVHDMILRMPDGYDTYIGEGGTVLSGGQSQRIALARALYGDPVLVVMDEPNANLDAEGDMALNAAILDLRRRHKTVVVMTHRPSALAAVDQVLIIENGRQIAFGARDEVLEARTKKRKADQQGRSGTSQEKASRQSLSTLNKRVDMPSFGEKTRPGSLGKQTRKAKTANAKKPDGGTV